MLFNHFEYPEYNSLYHYTTPKPLNRFLHLTPKIEVIVMAKKENVCGPCPCCCECGGKYLGWLVLAAGVLWLLQDYEIVSWWRVGWWALGALILGLMWVMKK